MRLLYICVYYMLEHTEEIASTDLGKSLTRFIRNSSLQVLVCFVSQEHDGNILSCALLRKKIHTHTHIYYKSICHLAIIITLVETSVCRSAS